MQIFCSDSYILFEDFTCAKIKSENFCPRVYISDTKNQTVKRAVFELCKPYNTKFKPMIWLCLDSMCMRSFVLNELIITERYLVSQKIRTISPHDLKMFKNRNKLGHTPTGSYNPFVGAGNIISFKDKLLISFEINSVNLKFHIVQKSSLSVANIKQNELFQWQNKRIRKSNVWCSMAADYSTKNFNGPF